jgi:hypothetical protein
LREVRLVEQNRLQSAGESTSVEWPLRSFKIISLSHSSGRVLIAERTDVKVSIHNAKRDPSTGMGLASATSAKAKSNAVAVKAFIGPASCFYLIGIVGNVLCSELLFIFV